METIVEQSDPARPLEYTGEVIAKMSSDKQSWTLMRTEQEGEALFINGEFQSCTADEAIYHEWLVHSALAGSFRKRRVLVLGGAEGCVLREVLRWGEVEHITQVDWDNWLVDYFKGRPDWNDQAYEDYRVRLVHEDVMKWLPEHYEMYDCIIIDLLDPHETSLEWFTGLLQQCKQHLALGGSLIINAGVVRKGEDTFACTLAGVLQDLWCEASVVFTALHTYVPSFQDEWGFFLVSSKQWSSVMASSVLPDGLKHFSKQGLIETVRWSEEYPEALREFWKGGAKKLAASPMLRRVELGEHYGC